MTIKEKILALQLGPEQTKAVLQIVHAAYVCSAANLAKHFIPNANSDILAYWTMGQFRHIMERNLPTNPMAEIGGHLAAILDITFENDLP